MPVESVIPEDIQAKYDIVETRAAAAILAYTHPQEWGEIITVLRDFVLCRSELEAEGGNKSSIAGGLDARFREFGWREIQFETSTVLTSTVFGPGGGVVEEAVPGFGHKVDNAKPGSKVMVEVEWNAKDGNLDRDLSNFRQLHELGHLDVGVMITRGDDIGPFAVKELGRKSSVYGSTTTRMGKLRPRLERGQSGGCPVLAFGVTLNCYDPDC